MNEESLFQDALSRPAEERSAYLEQACAGQPELRAAVEALLAAHERSGHVLDKPLVARLEATSNYQPDIAVGAVIAGRYKLREKLGEGGMGEVWVADQTEPVQRRVALKLIKTGMDSQRLLARFEQERQALALMDHPNIAKVFDAGIHSPLAPLGREGPGVRGSPYFVMELVKGLPLTKYCDDAKLTPKQRLELFIPVCQAVQHAHQKGVIHRDLKPSNILIGLYDGKPVPKVIDFGVAKATGSRLTDESIYTEVGSLVGTLEYMSPEQAELNNLDIDTRADIYALGVLLYELLTGSVPFSRKDLAKAGLGEMLRVIKEVEPPKPSTKLSGSGSLPIIAAQRQSEPSRLTKLVKGDLDWIVMKALEKDRSRRYETANGFAADVQRHLSGEPVLAAPPSAGYRLKKFIKRNKGPVVAAGLVFLALIIGMAGTTFGLIRAEARRVEAEQAKDQAQKRLVQIEKGVELLAGMLTGINPRAEEKGGDPLYVQLRQKAEQAAAELEGEVVGDPLAVARLQTILGSTLHGLGSYKTAVVMLEKARATRQQELGAEHPDTLASMNNLAESYRAAGILDLALPLLKETLELRKSRLGADHPDTLTSMHNLAGGYHSAGKLDLAISCWEETLKIRKVKLGADHLDTLATMNDLAAGYHGTGKQDLALPLWDQSLKLMRSKLGSNHPDTIVCIGNLAEGYRAAGKLDLALPLLEETLRIKKTKLGADHPDTLISMNNLGEGYREVGKLESALPLFEEALKLMKVRLGPDHPHALTCMNNLAVCYQSAGKIEQAVALYEETLKLRRAKLGPDHPDTLRSMGNLARGYQALGKLDLAVNRWEEVLELMKAKLGPSHPSTVTSMNNLARAYQASGQLAKAIPLFEQTLETAKATFGLEHRNTLGTMGSLGHAYAEAKQGEKAATTLTAFVDGMRKRLPKDSVQFAGLLATVSFDLIKCGQHADAEPLLRECLAIREKQEPDAWTTFNTMSMLGGALLGQKKYADAEPLLVKGYEGMKQRAAKMPKETKVRLTEGIERLVQLYEAVEKKDEAAKWRGELEVIKEAPIRP